MFIVFQLKAKHAFNGIYVPCEVYSMLGVVCIKIISVTTKI